MTSSPRLAVGFPFGTSKGGTTYQNPIHPPIMPGGFLGFCYKGVAIFYLFFCVTILLIFPNLIFHYLKLPDVIFLTILWSAMFFLYPVLNQVLPPETNPLPQVWFTSFERKFLLVKLPEILLQQFLIILFLYFSLIISIYPLPTFLFLFVFMHFILFINRRPVVAFIFSVLSLLGGIMFFWIYTTFITGAFFFSYLIHFLFYFTAGATLRFLMHTSYWK